MGPIKKLTFKIPMWPPSTNAIWRNVRVGRKNRTLLSKEARAFYRYGANWIRTPKEPIKGPVRVHIDLYTPHSQPYDIDNRLKAVLDLITKCGVWLDDSQVISISATKHPKSPQALVIVNIEPLETMTNGEQNPEQQALKAASKVT